VAERDTVEPRRRAAGEQPERAEPAGAAVPEPADPEAAAEREAAARPGGAQPDDAEPELGTPASDEGGDAPGGETDADHAGGELDVPDGVDLLEGEPRGGRRSVGIVVARFNGDVTNRLLARALDELDEAGVPAELVTVMPVPGAFELPLGAMALAKTRRFACIVALGCVVRGETPHFEYVAGEAASGLQLAALETGVPVAFGVLTVESVEQAEARIDRAADAVRSGLEMADVFSQLRASAAA
jgi:6,7-dimethyl-8-ribityllumazine synthase